MKVHILGAGAMGSLVAHELARCTKMTPVLLLKSKNRLDHFINEGSTMTLLRPQGPSDIISTTESLAAARGPPLTANGSPQMIENLIVATKTYSTEAALKPYVPHINADTKLLILQNGMGMAEALRDAFWQKQEEMPKMYQAISTHGAYKQNPTVVHHVGLGSLAISRVLTGSTVPERAPPLVEELLSCNALNAKFISSEDLLLRQMEKLVVNACINPLTAILDCLNGDLLFGSKIIPIMKRVIRECVDTFHAEYNLLKEIPEANTFLDEARLLNSVLDVCKNTAQNSSSMREDVRKLNRTEIQWINGYVVSLGFKHGVPTPSNKMLVSMVKNKLAIETAKETNAILRADTDNLGPFL